MATNAVVGTSLSMRSQTLFRFNTSLDIVRRDAKRAFTSISGPRSALISNFGRKNVSFSSQPRSIRLKISCALELSKQPGQTGRESLSGQAIFYTSISTNQAKPETVDKVCKIVKSQLALSDGQTVTGESKFQALGADSLDTVEIVMALEEEFGVGIEEDSAQTITTVQEAADLIEEIIKKKEDITEKSS
ncbi:Acyl carrier protein 1, chloroplastic, partial [Mucuna pruriens]